MARVPTAKLVIDCKPGPTLRAALDVTDLAVELAQLVPDPELIRRTQTLAETCQAHLLTHNAIQRQRICVLAN